MAVRLCVVLAVLVAAVSAQTTAGAPFNNPSFVTAFDATNAQITLTFANPVSYVHRHPRNDLCATQSASCEQL